MSRTAADSQPIPKFSPQSGTKAHRLQEAWAFTIGDAEKVVRWLNASKGTASYQRILFIRRELEELPFAFSSHRDAYHHVSDGVIRLGMYHDSGQSVGWPVKKLRIQRELHSRHVALNTALSRYIFRPRATYVLLARSWLFGMVPDSNQRWFQIQIGGQTISEADAALALVRLASTGDLRKVRLCEMCQNQWRVAAKSSYRFCSAECRERFYAKAPEYHSRKAANQRAYRERLKQSKAAK